MNPFNNRWALLGIVVVFLLGVAELVGSDERGGVLSQAAGSYAADGSGETAPGSDIPVVVVPAQAAVDASEPPDTPDEDEPQVIMAGSADVVDAEDPPMDEASEPDEIDPNAVSDEPVEEDGGEE